MKPIATITFSWEQLTELLESLALSPAHRQMAPELVSALAKQYLFLEETLLLREIVSMGICMADPTFNAEQTRPGSQVIAGKSLSSS